MQSHAQETKELLAHRRSWGNVTTEEKKERKKIKERERKKETYQQYNK